jgi:peptide alpha-N-acetyltransferase
MDIRLLHPSDIPHVQTTNITNLPENYFCKYYMYHQLSWPQLSYVAVDVRIAEVQAHEIEPLLTASPGLKTEEDTL